MGFGKLRSSIADPKWDSGARFGDCGSDAAFLRLFMRADGVIGGGLLCGCTYIYFAATCGQYEAILVLD